MDMKAAYLLHFQGKKAEQTEKPVLAMQQVEPEAWGDLCYRMFSETGVHFKLGLDWVLRMSKPKLYYQQASLAAALVQACPVLHKEYAPPLVSMGGSMHMVLSVVVRRAYVRARYTRRLVTTPDGGTIGLDWWSGSHKGHIMHAASPVVLCLHAFAGDSNESYMLFMCKEACNNGWRAVSMNYRGCGGTPLTNAKPMHIALTADVYAAVRHIRQQYPQAPVYLVGFSIGAYTMTKYVGEADSGVWPEDGKVQAAVLIGSGYDYAAELEKISRPAVLRILNFHYINCSWWAGYCKKHKAQLQQDPQIDLQSVKHATRTSQTEAALICPAWGYANIQAYYDDINGLNWIPKIKTPTLFLSAEDDPFLGESSPPRPYKQCESNPHTVLVLTAHGGHCAHLPLGSWVTGKAWMDTVAMQFFSAVSAHVNSQSTEAAQTPSSTVGGTLEQTEAEALQGKVAASSESHSRTASLSIHQAEAETLLRKKQ